MRNTISRSLKCTLRLWEEARLKQIPNRRSAFFQEKDRVMLRKTNAPTEGFLIGPLKNLGETEVPAGRVQHDKIIGRTRGSIVQSSRGTPLYADEPSMAEHILYVPRISTPIYPADAQFIVSLLDLHVGSLEHGANGPIEILECGSGHGSLTLHLAHALHGVNGPPPQHTRGPEWDEWLSKRKAVIWSLDNNRRRSRAAKDTVKSFRDGEYEPSITFKTARLQEFLTNESATRNISEFLSYIVLDLPFDNKDLKTCVEALLLNGTLLLFCPNLGQIQDAVLSLTEWGGPQMKLEKVVELGTNISGGRQWDVKKVRKRDSQLEPELPAKAFDPIARTPGPKANDPHKDSAREKTSGGPNNDEKPAFVMDAAEPSEETNTTKWAVRVRPRVGDKIVGGGFVAVFKKRLFYDRMGLDSTSRQSEPQREQSNGP